MRHEDVKNRIEMGLVQSFALVSEFSGGTDHYSVVVVTDAFAGVPLLKRHRMVLDLFQSEIGTGEVHALSIKAFTPEQWELEQKRTTFF
jgi:BolA-like protein 1